MKKVICILLLTVMLLPLNACGAQEPVSREFYFMDTLITVTLYASEAEAAPVFKECRRILSELDALWSRTKEESDTSRLNASDAGLSDLDARTLKVLETALDVSKKTDGAFDVTVLPLVELWQSAEEAQTLPSDVALADALARVGYGRLTVANGAVQKTADTRIDLGGIGKGAAIDVLIRYLSSTDISGGLVSFGSNVAVFGEKPDGSDFYIGLRDPHDRTDYAGALTLKKGEILSVSGDYERYYTVCGEKYHHILDPKTGYPAKTGLSSVAVVCRDGALADALSTALFVIGEERAIALYDARVYQFEAIFIRSDGSICVTAGLQKRFEKQ